MTQLLLILLEQTVIFNGEDNTQKPSQFPFCSFSFAPVLSSSRDAGMECKPNSHSSSIHEPCIRGNKYPEIVMAQVLACTLTGHTEIKQRRVETQPQTRNGMPMLCSVAQTGDGLKHSEFNTTSCSAAKASQCNPVSIS